jgi:predicted DsbA family dithiol-disulfide isomerase
MIQVDQNVSGRTREYCTPLVAIFSSDLINDAIALSGAALRATNSTSAHRCVSFFSRRHGLAILIVMRLTMTCYLDVISSWCNWAIPAWLELRRRYAERVDFNWKIALMDATGMPASRAQMEWFYRRSGMLMRSPEMLHSEWYEAGRSEFLAPNCVAEAARDFGIADDRVWITISNGGLREGKHFGDWDVAAQIGAEAAKLDPDQLLERAKSPEIEARVRKTTAEFHALQVTQRPTFVIDTPIGDRAVFSGFAKAAPLAATLDAMLDDIAGYKAHAAHFGEPPRA